MLQGRHFNELFQNFPQDIWKTNFYNTVSDLKYKKNIMYTTIHDLLDFKKGWFKPFWRNPNVIPLRFKRKIISVNNVEKNQGYLIAFAEKMIKSNKKHSKINFSTLQPFWYKVGKCIIYIYKIYEKGYCKKNLEEMNIFWNFKGTT